MAEASNPLPQLPPEILNEIFANLQVISRESLKSVALVPRRWNNIALEWIWWEVEGLLPLLKLLGPITFSKQETATPQDLADTRADFADGNALFETRNWNHFLSRACLVKSLVIRKPNFPESSTIISPDVFTSLLAALEHHGQQTLLPALRFVVWEAHETTTMEQLVYFFARRSLLHEIDIFFGWRTSPEALRAVLRYLVRTPTPALRCFKVRLDSRMSYPSIFNHNISDVIRIRASDIQSLTQLTLQGVGLTPNVVRAISLHDQLMELHLDHLVETQEKGIPELLQTIVAGCPALRIVYLVHLGGGLEDLSLRFFVPLLECKALETLYISSWKMFQAPDEDIKLMGEAWPSLKRLKLVPHPTTSLSEKTPSILTLLRFAEAFPSLEYLAIPIIHLPCHQLPPFTSIRCWMSLQALDIGKNNVEKATLEGVLSHLLPHKCQVSYRK